MAALTVAVLNLKGGVGKTTICFNLAGAYSQLGLRVLLMDCDSQTNLSLVALGAPVQSFGFQYTIVDLYTGAFVPNNRQLIVDTPIPNVRLLPGSTLLENYNDTKPSARNNRRALREFVDDVKGDFDIILIDCPPSRMLVSWSALLAADGCLIPVRPDFFSGLGLGQMRDVLDEVRNRAHPGLRVFGYVINLIQKRVAANGLGATALQEIMAHELFDTMIYYRADFESALACCTPVVTFKPKTQAAQSIKQLAAELLRRAAQKTPGREVA